MAGQVSKVALLVSFQVACLLFAAVGVFPATAATAAASEKRLKILYYTAADDGSHHLTNTKIASALVARGHSVTFLLSASCTKWQNASGSEQFDFRVYKSLYTGERRGRNLDVLSRAGLRGEMHGLWRMTVSFVRNLRSPQNMYRFHYDECDTLLGDSATLRQLREDAYDLLVGEDLSNCNPLLAETLGLAFVLVGDMGIIPSKGSW